MARQELEDALRRESETQARALWQEAEDEAKRLRSDTEQELERARQSALSRLQVEITALRDMALAEARRQAQTCRLQAEDSLAQRLRALAEELLEEFAVDGGTALFEALAAEIPPYAWQRVKTHPRDATTAEALFPGADILATQDVRAGLEVQSSDGRVQIINTLKKRLEHIWPELLPELLRELRRLAGDDETVA